MERSTAWAVAMALATVGGSLAAACLMPFVALAAMAADTLPRREGIATVAVAWAVNQAIGFTVLGYPTDAGTLGWGAALGVAAMVAYVAAVAVVGRHGGLLRLVAGAAVAFAAYELALYLYGVAGGGSGAFTPSIVTLLARNEALWLVGLVAAREAVVRIAPGAAPAVRAAG